jgi:hypothetical protein
MDSGACPGPDPGFARNGGLSDFCKNLTYFCFCCIINNYQDAGCGLFDTKKRLDAEIKKI